MKYIVLLTFVISIILLLLGVYFQYYEENEIWQHKCYGYGIAILFFITMPLFLFMRYRKRLYNIEKRIEDEEKL